MKNKLQLNHTFKKNTKFRKKRKLGTEPKFKLQLNPKFQKNPKFPKKRKL